MPMGHSERLSLAHALAYQYAARRRTILAGLYGSTARGTDTPWSDLELLIIVEDGEESREIAALYAGTAIGARVRSVSQLLEQIENPDTGWPFTMGILDTLQVIHGDPRQVDRWLSMGRGLPEERFHKALAGMIPSLVYESCGRIFSCALRGNTADLCAAILETLLEMSTALCLLNRTWVHHDYYQGLLETMRFPILPEGYDTLAPALWHCREPAQAAALAERLLDAYKDLLAQYGLAPRDWADLAPEAWPL